MEEVADVQCNIFRCPEGHTHVEFYEDDEMVFTLVLDDAEVDLFVSKLRRARNNIKGGH